MRRNYRMRGPGRNRPAFTLLELLLATAIGVTLLGGLYLALHMTLAQTQASRDAVDVEDVSRAVFNKVSLDMAGVLGPLPPKCGGNEASASAVSSGILPPEDDTGTGAGTDTGGMTGEATESAEPATPMIPFQVGVIGNAQELSLFASRVPRVLARPGALNQGNSLTAEQAPSDMVRIDYWLSSSGLCRRERPWVTAEEVGGTEQIDKTDESQYVIADDVEQVSFEYLASGGGGYSSSWELSALAPPRAVKVTLTFKIPNPRGGEPVTKTASQVIAVRTSPGVATPTLVDPVVDTSSGTTEDTTGGGGMGGGGTGGGGTGGGGTGGGGMGGGGTGGGGMGGGGGAGGGRGGGGTGGGSGAGGAGGGRGGAGGGMGGGGGGPGGGGGGPGGGGGGAGGGRGGAGGGGR